MSDTNILITDRWLRTTTPENYVRALNHPEQKRLKSDLINHKYRNYVIAAGRRSYKTERFCKRFLISLCIDPKNKGKLYYAGGPTIGQAKAILWSDLKQLSHPVTVADINETDRIIKYHSGVTLKVIGLKEFKRVQGQLMHGIVITEYQDCDPGVYNESIEPMINDTRGWCIKEGRPSGKNHFFDDFLKGKHNIPGWQSYQWTSEDILTTEQIDEARANLSKPDYEREYKASFETGGQRPYYAYNEKNNKAFQIMHNLPFIVTCDFNAQEKPMSWVIGQKFYYAPAKSDVTVWHKELCFRFTNTKTMCEYLDQDYFAKLPVYPSHIIFYGDYAGKKHTSNSSKSDWDIIENYFNNKAKITVNYKPCRSIRDTVSATNARLENAKGEIKMFINPGNCPELVKDWEYCAWKPNGRELDDRNPYRTHLCRAVDYYSDYEYPIGGVKEHSTISIT